MIDLHTHSNFSPDSDLRISSVIKAFSKEVSKNEEHYLSITDHNFLGISFPIDIDKNIHMLPGIELSVSYKPPEWSDPVELHLICFWLDKIEDDYVKKMKELCDVHYEQKETFIDAVLVNIWSQTKIVITYDEVVRKAGGKHHTSLKHVAKCLYERGYGADVDTILYDLTDPFSNMYITPNQYFSFPELNDSCLIETVKNSKACVFLAHPLSYCLNDEELRSLVRYIKSFDGLVFGIEVYAPEYMMHKEKYEFLEKLAGDHEVLMSIGSDHHKKDQPFTTSSEYEVRSKKVMADIIHAWENAYGGNTHVLHNE